MQFLFDRNGKPSPAWAKAGTVVGLLLIYSLLCVWSFSGTVKDWEKVWAYRATFWSGWLTTIGISAAALVLSTVIGALAALARRSSFLPLRYTSVLYVETVRGLPLLVLLLFGYYGVMDQLGWDDRISGGIVILSLFSGAYIAEILRGRSGSPPRARTGGSSFRRSSARACPRWPDSFLP